jgi:nucleotide-binding universal stress UspA family protein
MVAPATALVLGYGRDPASAHALGVAADLARRLNAHLHVVHGVDLGDYPADPDAADWEEQGRRTQAEQRQAVRTALDHLGQPWTYHAARGDPAALIAAVADRHDAVMIIVGTRGEGYRAALDRLLGGSVSHRVIGHQHRPVLVVPAPRDDRPGAGPHDVRW